MNATEQDFLVVLSILTSNPVTVNEIQHVTIQVNPIIQHFTVVPFIML